MSKAVLETLLEREKKLKARIRQQQAKLRTQDRKDDTRRKILAGAAVLDKAGKDPAYDTELRDLLTQFLTRNDDRALFGLPHLPEAPTGKAEEPSTANP